MKRGEVWWANLPKPVGRRPVVLLSRNAAYAVRASVTVAGPFDLAAQAHARALHLSLEPLSLQQLLVHAASLSAEEKVSA